MPSKILRIPWQRSNSFLLIHFINLYATIQDPNRDSKQTKKNSVIIHTSLILMTYHGLKSRCKVILQLGPDISMKKATEIKQKIVNEM